MKRLKSLVAAACAVSYLFAVGGDYDYSGEMYPSQTAPVSNPPQLIILGSDDNTSVEGLDWIVNYLKSKKHADGTALRMSFYSNVQYWNYYDGETLHNREDLISAHQRAYAEQHEVTNHTKDHVYCVEGKAGPTQKRMGIDEIRAQMQAVTDIMVANGISTKTMKGFRTPYLAYSDSTFSAAVAEGFTYDCSVNEGGEWGQVAGNYYWPYTLDQMADNDGNYAPGNNKQYSWWSKTYDTPIRKHTGYWELPCYIWAAHPQDTAYMSTVFQYEHGGKITGLDWNLWAEANFNKDQSLRCLKYTLDLMYAGNRTPFTVGMHSQYYIDYKGQSSFPNITSHMDRRWVLEQFIDYALSKGDDIYFVSGAQAIAYCMNPVSADSFNPDDYLPIDGDENVAPTNISLSNKTVKEGETTIGTLSAVDQNSGDTHTFTVESGSFTIDGSTLKSDGVLAVGDHDVKIKATDQGGLSVTKDFTISVTSDGQDTDTLVAPNIAGYCGWDAVFDEIGSKVTLEKDSADGYVVGAHGTINRVAHTILKDGEGKDSVAYDAYASICAYYDSTITFKDITAMQIDYKADKDFFLILPIEGVTDNNGAGHRITLEATGSDFGRVIVNDILGTFKQPSWATKVDLDLSKVSAFSFELADESVGAIEGSLAIKQVKMPGYPVDIPVIETKNNVLTKSIKVTTLTQSKLKLFVPTHTTYEIIIYSNSGRVLAQYEKELLAGENSVSFGEKVLSQGVVILGVNGNGQTAVSKMIVK